MVTLKSKLFGFHTYSYVSSKDPTKIFQIHTLKGSSGIIGSIAREGNFAEEKFTPSFDYCGDGFVAERIRDTKQNIEKVHIKNVAILKKLLDDQKDIRSRTCDGTS